MLILCHHRRLVYGRVLDVLLLKCHVTSHYNLVLVLIITPSEFVPPPDPGAITLCLTFRHDRSHLQKLPLCLTTPGGMFQKGKKKEATAVIYRRGPAEMTGLIVPWSSATWRRRRPLIYPRNFSPRPWNQLPPFFPAALPLQLIQ